MRRRLWSFVLSAVAVGWWLAGTPAFAFLAPEDTAGPLTARIEGPEEVTAADTAIPLAVVVENSGDAPVEGNVRVAVIDLWRVTPGDAVGFRVEGKASTRVEFSAVAGQGTYNALYPIHAYVEFESGGTKQTAHPISIVKTRLPQTPKRAAAVVWEPLTLRPNSALALWRQPVYRVVVKEFERAPRTMEPGWQGTDPETSGNVSLGASIERGTTREVVQMHPPYAGGRRGSMGVEFPVQLPAEKPVVLHFGNAIRDHNEAQNEPPSDGVTFRASVAPLDAPDGETGEVVFERHTAAKVWEDGEVDLNAYAGQAVRVFLECHPGPKEDPTCDQAYWGEPVLVAGTLPEPLKPEERPKLTEGRLQWGAGQHVFSVTLGRNGLLDSVVTLEDGAKAISFEGFKIRVAGSTLGDAYSVCTLLDVKEEAGEHGARVRHRFEGPKGRFDLLGEVWADGPAMRVRFWLENQPEPKAWEAVYIEETGVGAWSRDIERVYAGPGNVIEKPQSFMLPFDGHRLSTSFVGFDFVGGPSLVQAVDVPPRRLRVASDERIATLETAHAQTLTFIPAANAWEAAKAWREVNGLRPAGGVTKAAGRFVFDLWGGRYAESAEALKRSFAYGLTDAMVVWHNWQRWGYDYRLPDICPPNPDLGTEAEFKGLIQTCKEHDVVFAPHDNYIDFYPDADGYSYEHIAFTETGAPMPAWLNEGRGAQSYRWRVDHIQPFLERNIDIIARDYAPTGFFIDVWSSASPYDYWTRDGQFFDRVYTRNAWGEFFAWIRDQLGNDAPQISESGHDQLIGWLDGAQTNHLRVDPKPNPEAGWKACFIPCADAERIPWFDVAHHDRFVLHGAGYSTRYEGGLDGRLHGIYSDDYIATEVLTGHPAMTQGAFGRNEVRKYWLLHDIMRGLALKTIESVEFVDGDIHRQCVRWDNGAEVWVNRGEPDWTVGERVLPQYGFYARVPMEQGEAEASIERHDGVIVEWSRSNAMMYFNARPVVDGRTRVSVTAEDVRAVDEKTVEVKLRWNVEEPLAEPWRVYVHLMDKEGKIRMQGDHDPAPPTTEWKGVVNSTARVTLRDDIVMGDSFRLRVGLYKPGTRERLRIQGRDPGDRSALLGTVQVQGDGGKLTGVLWTPLADEPDALLARLNPERKTIDFGAVQMEGACRLTLEDGALVVTPLPNSPAFSVRLNPAALPWNLGDLNTATTVSESGETLNQTPINRTDGAITLPCEPEVFQCRLVP